MGTKPVVEVVCFIQLIAVSLYALISIKRIYIRIIGAGVSLFKILLLINGC